MVSVVMAILLVLILWAATKTCKLNYPVDAERTQQLISRAQYLNQLRSEIEKMPVGYDKMKAQDQWLEELNNLLIAEEQSDADISNSVIQFNRYQRN